MRKLLWAVTFTAMVSLAEAQQIPDPRVADLVRRRGGLTGRDR